MYKSYYFINKEIIVVINRFLNENPREKTHTKTGGERQFREFSLRGLSWSIYLRSLPCLVIDVALVLFLRSSKQQQKKLDIMSPFVFMSRDDI